MKYVPRKVAKKIGQTLLLFVHRTCILLRCGKIVAADALFGCFLPRLGRLWQRRRPLFWSIFRSRYIPLIRRLVAGARGHGPRDWSGQEIELLTDDVCCDRLRISGKPLAANTLLGCFLPRLGPLVATPAASLMSFWLILRSFVSCLPALRANALPTRPGIG